MRPFSPDVPPRLDFHQIREKYQSPTTRKYTTPISRIRKIHIKSPRTEPNHFSFSPTFPDISIQCPEKTNESKSSINNPILKENIPKTAKFKYRKPSKYDFAQPNYFDNFTSMYAELQYNILTMNKKRLERNFSKQIAFETELKKIMHENVEYKDSLEKAETLITKINKIKSQRNYYITSDEFCSHDIHLLNESDSEIQANESKLSDKIRLFLEQNCPNNLKVGITKEQLGLIPHLSFYLGNTRDLFISATNYESNQTQPASISHYSKNKKIIEKVFGNIPRGDYSKTPSKDKLKLRDIKNFGFWESKAFIGDTPKILRGKFVANFMDNDKIYFLHIVKDTGMTQIYEINLNGRKWVKIEFKQNLNIPAYLGESAIFIENKIITYSGLLPQAQNKQDSENEIRIFDLSIFIGIS